MITPLTPTELREKVKNKIKIELNKAKENGYFDETEEEINKIANNLEKTIFNYAIQQFGSFCKWSNYKFRNSYVRRSMTIISNISPDGLCKNNEFLKIIIDNKNYSSIERSNAYNFAPEKLKTYKQSLVKLSSEELEELKYNKGMFKCGRCKSTNTTHTQAMTKSADEPITNFITCLNCDKRWKFS